MKIKISLEALKGLPVGDLVKRVTCALGVGKKDCGGCEKRKQSLNRFRLPK